MTKSNEYTDSSHAAVHRRSFLKGSGAVAAATALHSTAVEAEPQATANVVSGATTITLNVNGGDHKVTV